MKYIFTLFYVQNFSLLAFKYVSYVRMRMCVCVCVYVGLCVYAC